MRSLSPRSGPRSSGIGVSAAQQQIRELQRLLGKKTLENEILREAVERVTGSKKGHLRLSSWPEGGR
jgi:transposase